MPDDKKTPEITSSDRKTVKGRVQGFLKAKGLSQRKAEIRLNLATGVMSKIWSGTMKLTLDLLLRLAKLVEVDPFEIVGNTAFEKLLEAGPESEESPVIRELRERADSLSERVVALEAENTALQDALAEERDAKSNLVGKAEDAVARVEPLEIEVNSLRQSLAEKERAHHKAVAELRNSVVTVEALRATLATASARETGQQAALAEQRRLTGAWRGRAVELENLAQMQKGQLEDLHEEYWALYEQADSNTHELARLAQHNRQLATSASSSVPGGALLGGTALAFLVGLAVGDK